MERLRSEQVTGLTTGGLRKWAMVFVLLGIFGRNILQIRYLGMMQLDSDQLLNMISSDSQAMVVATISIVLQFLETCAAPIFCFLLTEGFIHTSDVKKYIARVGGLALISELPYNFAMGGKLLELQSRNPVFGLLIGLILLTIFKAYSRKSLKNVCIKAVSVLAALIWCRMLAIDSGMCAVVLVSTFWMFRNKPNFRNLAGGGAAMLCSLFSLYYMISPMGIMALHFYNGEKGQENRLVNYLFYPVALTAMGIVGLIVF